MYIPKDFRESDHRTLINVNNTITPLKDQSNRWKSLETVNLLHPIKIQEFIHCTVEGISIYSQPFLSSMVKSFFLLFVKIRVK